MNPVTIPGTLEYDIANLTGTSTSTNGTVLTGTYNGAAYTRIKLPTITIPHIVKAVRNSAQWSPSIRSPRPILQIAEQIASTRAMHYHDMVPMPGGAKVGIEKYDNYLRKLRFVYDSSGNSISAPVLYAQWKPSFNRSQLAVPRFLEGPA